MIIESHIQNMIKSLISGEARAIESIYDQIDQNFWSAVDIILRNNYPIIVTGSGTSHSVALRFAHLLSCCGTPAFYIHPGDAIHGSAGVVIKGMILIAISKGGETYEINKFVEIAKERGAFVIGITGNEKSTLAQLSNLIIKIKITQDIDPFGAIALGSSLVISAMCDAFCVALLNLRGYSFENFIRTHPGGEIGRKFYSDQIG
jgi:D-arabinose 5-phosphate isomerase GutQ